MDVRLPADTIAEVVSLATSLSSRLTVRKNTSSRLKQVSRADAVCWFIVKRGGLVSAREIKLFVTEAMARRNVTRYRYVKKVGVDCCVADRDPQTGKLVRLTCLEPCSALLNTCYGGVGKDVSGELTHTWYSGKGENVYKHYGPVAPLWRPKRGWYAPTVGGFQRSARVERMFRSL